MEIRQLAVLAWEGLKLLGIAGGRLDRATVRRAAAALASLLFTGCAVTTMRLPEEPVWAFEVTYAANIDARSVGYGSTIFECEGTRQGTLTSIQRQGPAASAPTATPCRLARVMEATSFGSVGFKVADSPNVYWTMYATPKSGIAFNSREMCGQVNRVLQGGHAAWCEPVFVIFVP